MFVTTAGRTNEEMILQAKAISYELGVPFLERKKQSVEFMQREWGGSCIVVGKERLELYPFGEKTAFFFHPNSAMFRIKRLCLGESDPFVDVCKLSDGMSFLDCTLGLASDSIVASFVVGASGKVIGLEADKYLSFIVGTGLRKWSSGRAIIDEAMRSVEVNHAFSYDILKSLPAESFDCVYFDPMFDKKILESDGIKSLGKIAVYDDLRAEWIEEALRVARQRVVLKDHYLSKRFTQFGFEVLRRKTAKFHYGVIEKEIFMKK
ncbi:class I SAM-dependent methyltransferase [Pseudoneobacillus sp. C159]